MRGKEERTVKCCRIEKTEIDELAEINRSKSEVEQSVVLLLKDADKYSQEAEKKRDLK